MIESIAFLCGMITMMIVWFFTEGSSHSPYWRGYRQGYFEAMQAYHKFRGDKDEEGE